MNIISQTPKRSLNKAFLKQRPLRSEIDSFKHNLIRLLGKIDEIEREENQKNHIRDFLRDTYYKDSNEINTKDYKDLVIHLGKTNKENVGVIVEAKRPSNKAEMLSADKPNAKALHEIILYYLDERIIQGNNELKTLIITNVYEWFIFDANFFDKHIYRNTRIKKLFDTYTNDKKDTSFFYEEAAKIIQQLDTDIPCTYFDIRGYEEILKNDDLSDDKNLIALFKILSPYHLLKEPFADDSNKLDERFYKELLHIIGLEEAKESGKNVIRRKTVSREAGSLMENIINILETEDVFHNISDISRFGEQKPERLFNIALELSITWINRILFLKLLEGQLYNYHHGDESFHFLNIDTINDYDELYKLFHQVLARTNADRTDAIKTKYSHIPYLNSSLFEISELEQQTIKINSLDNSAVLSLMKGSVLSKSSVNSKLPSLEYLFTFLDSYDFASEGTEDIQDDSKTLVNASVLGKVFEKINGYKDGSIFTPGFITMYMCRQAIRPAIVQKFKDTYNWNVEKFSDLKNYLADRKSGKDILEFNSVINSLRICDPAVGSGHFLVSSLNELIVAKSELGIFADENGIRLTDYEIVIENDELIITDLKGDLFSYTLNTDKATFKRSVNKEAQRLQKTLFHEKQSIIENCLFGVDINQNSVKICRLRLWIELLKNAYYKEESKYTELETLPNIDINIKCGNSLLYRFALDSDLSVALKAGKYSVEQYRGFVNSYKQEKNRTSKREIENIINSIKSDFRTEISKNDPKLLRFYKLNNEYNALANQTQMFEETKKQIKERTDKQVKLQKEIAVLKKELDEIQTNAVYKNAFEWRIEFPEVLDNEGKFKGFDAIIANPPYMRVQEIERTQPAAKIFYENTYRTAKGSYEFANLFFELAVNLSKQTSHNAFIFPHKFLNSDNSDEFRNYLIEGKYIDKLAHFGANMIFDNADTYTCIAFFSKKQNDGILFQRFPFKSDYKKLIFKEKKFQFLSYQSIKKASSLYGSNKWILFDNETGFKAFERIYNQKSKVVNKFEIFVGLQTSKDEIYVLDLIEEYNNSYKVKVPLDDRIIEVEKQFFKPFLMGKENQRYGNLSPKRVVFFPYQLDKDLEIISEQELAKKYPLTYQYINLYEKEFKKRESGKAAKMKCWYAYIYPKNLNKFEQPKLSSMEICSNHPNVTLNINNYYHTTVVYSWIKKETTTEDYKYFLAIANSKLMWWFLLNTGDTLQGDARRFKTNYLNPFPLPEEASEDVQKPFNALVDQILEAKKQNQDTTALESQIDTLVYNLYNLTPDEIKTVETSK